MCASMCDIILTSFFWAALAQVPNFRWWRFAANAIANTLIAEREYTAALREAISKMGDFAFSWDQSSLVMCKTLKNYSQTELKVTG